MGNAELFFDLYIGTLVLILGTVFGSFVNCASSRIAHGESFLKGRSHCMNCGHELGALDLIPVLSFLGLRGRCRYCGAKISVRYPLTEVAAGVFSLILLARYGLSVEFLLFWGFSMILLGVGLVDLETFEIPDGFHVVSLIWWLVMMPFREGNRWEMTINGLLGGLCIAGGLLVISLIMDRVLGKESLGGGDIKLFFVTGLYLGPWVNLFTLMLSCLIGLFFILISEKRTETGGFAFGPSIALAAAVSMVIGGPVTEWYLSLFAI